MRWSRFRRAARRAGANIIPGSYLVVREENYVDSVSAAPICLAGCAQIG
ncbi:MAG: hypothetical protein ABIV11_04580 [Gemmatimonadaceae bacterium]